MRERGYATLCLLRYNAVTALDTHQKGKERRACEPHKQEAKTHRRRRRSKYYQDVHVSFSRVTY
jgi:hypothetical protein